MFYDACNMAADGLQSCGDHGPTLQVAGVSIGFSPAFNVDLSAVIAAFPSLPNDWNALALRDCTDCEFPASAQPPLASTLMFLIRRCKLIPEDERANNVLAQLRNALVSVAGCMVERALVGYCVAHGSRAAHQKIVERMFWGKRSTAMPA